MLVNIDKQLIQATSNVHWKNEPQGWRIRLDPITIINKEVQYTGQAVMRLNENGKFDITAEGSGNIYGVLLSGFQVNYANEDQAILSIKGLLKGGMLQKYFPGIFSFLINSKNNRTQINLKNRNIAGNIVIDKRARYFVTANLSRLYIQLKTGSSTPFDLNPNIIPSVSLKAHDFYINHQEIGDLHFIALPVKNGVDTKIKLNAPFAQLHTNGIWTRINKKDETQFCGSIYAKDFGKWLYRAHAINRIKGGTLESRFYFHANVSPFNLTLENMTGGTVFRIKKAVILNHKRGSKKNYNPIDGILNLISLDSITSFITLDFSSLKRESEGFEILWMAGSVSLKEGWLKTEKVKLQSPQAEIDFSGTIHLTDGKNHLLMTIYPNLIPKETLSRKNIISTLIRLPIWLWKKISSWFLNPFFHLDYRITGTLSKPIVKKA